MTLIWTPVCRSDAMAADQTVITFANPFGDLPQPGRRAGAVRIVIEVAGRVGPDPKARKVWASATMLLSGHYPLGVFEWVHEGDVVSAMEAARERGAAWIDLFAAGDGWRALNGGGVEGTAVCDGSMHSDGGER